MGRLQGPGFSWIGLFESILTDNFRYCFHGQRLDLARTYIRGLYRLFSQRTQVEWDNNREREKGTNKVKRTLFAQYTFNLEKGYMDKWLGREDRPGRH